MFSSEIEAIIYINENKNTLLSELQERQVKKIYENENTRINVMKEGKRLIKFINRYEGENNLLDIYKDIIDLKLL